MAIENSLTADEHDGGFESDEGVEDAEGVAIEEAFEALRNDYGETGSQDIPQTSLPDESVADDESFDTPQRQLGATIPR